MSATQSADFVFTPKVWKDHIEAFFVRKLVAGRFALRDNSLEAQPGLTVAMPFFNKIGDAEEPAEDEGLQVDKLSDDSFTATVKEVGKAVGIKKKAFKTSAAKTDTIISNVQMQIGRVMAEKVDKDLIAEFSTPGNYTDGFLAAVNTDLMTVRRLNAAKVAAFGDRHNESVVCMMHSTQFLDMMNDTTAGFLQGNSLDPLWKMDGFEGRVLGMAIVTIDTMPAGPTIGGANSRQAFIHKLEPYGFIMKQEMELESDYDILQREWVFTGNQWYAVKSFHQKISADYKRTARILTATSI